MSTKRRWLAIFDDIRAGSKSTQAAHPLAFATDVRISEQGDAHVANHTSARYDAWRPYLGAFGSMRVLARRGRGDSTILSSGPGVAFSLGPNYHDVRSLVRSLPGLWTFLNPRPYRLVIGRLPEPLSVVLLSRAALLRQQYVAIVVADVELLLRDAPVAGALLARLGGAYVRLLLRRSSGIIYVTRKTLQQRYPPPRNVPTLARSNVLVPSVLLDVPVSRDAREPLRIITVGALQTLAKGQDILIRALALLGPDSPITLTIVGAGKSQPQLERLAQELSLAQRVHFTGQIDDPSSLLQLLDSSDLFVLASRSEGLPRAMVEAMARGLPVLGSAVGGIPEIVSPENLVEPSTPEEWAKRIASFASLAASEREGLAKESLVTANQIAADTAPERLAHFLRSIVE